MLSLFFYWVEPPAFCIFSWRRKARACYYKPQRHVTDPVLDKQPAVSTASLTSRSFCFSYIRWSTSEGEWSEYHRKSILRRYILDPGEVRHVRLVWTILAGRCISALLSLFVSPWQRWLSWTLCDAKRWGYTAAGEFLPLSLMCFFFLLHVAPVLQRSCDVRPHGAALVWGVPSWDSSHEMPAARLSHQSSLSRPPNQARAALLLTPRSKMP